MSPPAGKKKTATAASAKRRSVSAPEGGDLDAASLELALPTRLSSVQMMLIALAGIFSTTVLVFAGFWGWSNDNQTFATDGSFLIWFFLIAAQLAVWPIAILAMVSILRRISASRVGGRIEIALAAAVFAAAAAAIAILGAYGPTLPDWLPGYRARISILSGLAIAAALMPAIGIWKVQLGLRTLLRRAKQQQPPSKEDVRILLDLKDALGTSLSLLGVILSAAILGAAAERNAVSSYADQYVKPHNPHFDINHVFPLDYITLYGLLLSILVALAYLPAHINYLSVGRRYSNTFFPLTPPEQGWQDQISQRNAFEQLLDLQSSAGANLKASIVVLAPLLTSITGLLSQ